MLSSLPASLSSGKNMLALTLVSLLGLTACDSRDAVENQAIDAALIAATSPSQASSPPEPDTLLNPEIAPDTRSLTVKIASAKTSSEKRVQTKVLEVATACGNRELKASIDWSAHDNYDYTDFSWPKNKPQALEATAAQINHMLDVLISDCGSQTQAPLYKDKIAKLTHIQLIGQQDIKERHAAYSVIDDGKTLHIKLNGSVSFWTSDDDKIRKALKKG